MKNRIAHLVTEEGLVLRLDKRTAAVIAEAYKWQADLEACEKGQLVLDFKDGSVSSSLRKHSEGRRIE